VITKTTVVAVLTIHDIATVITRLSIPVMQGYIGAVGAVSVEDASYHCEKVTKPAFFRSCSYCSSTLTLTELLITDMRVSNIFTCGCWMRIKGNATVGAVLVKVFEPV
jgi:hypothetical protein